MLTAQFGFSVLHFSKSYINNTNFIALTNWQGVCESNYLGIYE